MCDFELKWLIHGVETAWNGVWSFLRFVFFLFACCCVFGNTDKTSDVSLQLSSLKEVLFNNGTLGRNLTPKLNNYIKQEYSCTLYSFR